jgi:hypothetical protein
MTNSKENLINKLKTILPDILNEKGFDFSGRYIDLLIQHKFDEILDSIIDISDKFDEEYDEF